MTVTEVAILVCAFAALACPAALAWGLWRVSKAISSGPPPISPMGMPDLPPPSKEDINALVSRFKEIKDRRDGEYGLRGGMPDPANMRPGRHVNTPE